jgi:hypothetical protein
MERQSSDVMAIDYGQRQVGGGRSAFFEIACGDWRRRWRPRSLSLNTTTC